ncbi:MAG: ABC transporter transmembrane domain-containing protein [Saprospiraceae bacterium]
MQATAATSEKTAKKVPNKDQLRRATRIFAYLKPFRVPFALSMVVLAVGSLIFLVIMALPGEIINIINDEGSYGLTIDQVFLLIAGLLVLQALFGYIRVRLQAVVSERSMALLRRDLFARIVSLGIPFFEQRRVGELTSRITNDVTKIQGVFSLTLAEFLRQLIVLTGGIVYILFTMNRLALITLVTFPFVVVAAMFFGRYVRKLTKQRQDQLAQSNVIVEETLQNIHTVKAYTNEPLEVNRYDKSIAETVRISLLTANVRGLFAAFIIVALFGSLFFIIWRAALLVQSGDLPVGDLFNYAIFVGIIGAAIASLGNFYTEIVAAIGSSDRIIDILDGEAGEEETTIVAETANAGAEMPVIRGNIVYRDVRFSYPTRTDIEVLKGIDLTVEPGQRVALVGASGSGKSTLVSLLLRFYHPQSGEITVDGRPIDDYPLRGFRSRIGLVPQEVMLFGGTIGENIAYGRPGATDEELREAAVQANAWEFIDSFPEGLDTLVGERGIKLSGGQRQRIAIARAILKDPAILLLDEATSSLDAESERVVQEALNRLMERRTSIIIAHRLATIRDADRIYVLEHGRIVESGTHDELTLDPDGAYNSLAKLQFEQA